MADLALLVGPIGALVLVPVAVALLALGRRPQWALWVGAALVVVVVISLLGYWVTWGWAFDYAHAYEDVPSALETRVFVLEVVCAAAVIALVLTAGATYSKKKQHA